MPCEHRHSSIPRSDLAAALPMARDKPRNTSASIRQRLLNHSTAIKTDSNLVLIWYGLEQLSQRDSSPSQLPVHSDVENSPLQGDHYGVSTVAGIELWQNALHVCLDRALGDVELGGDHFVRL